MLTFPDPNVETEYTDPNGSVWAFNGTGWVRQCDCPDGGGGGSGSGDSHWNNVELLINADGLPDGSTDIVDASGTQTLTNVNNVLVSTSTFKYGTGSLDFSQTSNNALTFDPIAFGTGDFTLEGWAYLNQVNAQQAFIDFRATSTQGDYPTIMFVGSGSKLSFYTQSTEKIKMPEVAPANTWFHWAAVRSSGTTTLYVDGISQGSFADNINYLAGNPAVGSTSYTVGNSSLRGYLDDVRVTKGVARYTSDFIPPEKLPTETVILKGSQSVQISIEPQESGNDVEDF